jgi:hypothetical protein
VQAAVASYLSPDSDEAAEAAVVGGSIALAGTLERLERDVTISNEAIALFVKAWLTATPSLRRWRPEGAEREGPGALCGISGGAVAPAILGTAIAGRGFG